MKKKYLSEELESQNLGDFIQSLDYQMTFSKNNKPVPYHRVLDTIFLNIEAHDTPVEEILMNEYSFNQIISNKLFTHSIEKEMNMDKLKQGIKGIYHGAIIRIYNKIPDNNILGLSDTKHRSYSLIEGTNK